MAAERPRPPQAASAGQPPAPAPPHIPAATVHYSDGGAGPAVVALHGQPGDASNWHHVGALLGPGLRLIVPDRPGWGATGGEAQGIAGNAAAVIGLLDRLEIAEATLLAHSWSAAAAITAAATRPDRIHGLVLVAPVGPPSSLSRLDRVLGARAGGVVLSYLSVQVASRLLALPWVMRAVAPGTRGLGATVARRFLKTLRRGHAWRSFLVEQRALLTELDAVEASLPGLHLPAAVVVGQRDRIAPASGGIALARAIADARLVLVPGAGHLLPMSAPGIVAAVVREVAFTRA